jgi:hypothetical protein
MAVDRGSSPMISMNPAYASPGPQSMAAATNEANTGPAFLMDCLLSLGKPLYLRRKIFRALE